MAIAKIEEVVEDFVNLKRRGVNMLGLCPFHDEKTPSFTVSPAKNIYKCFGCGKGGDPVRFVMDHESFSFPEAIRYLANRYNIELQETENTQEEKDAKAITDSYYIINEFAKDYYQHNLFNKQEGQAVGLSYFKERGYNKATIEKFQLGFALSEYDDFTQEAIRKKYNEEHLKTLGITTKKGFDFFRSRVMFTIHNLSGKVIGFGGRTLSSDKKTPKYINSIESDIYNKRKTLYGLYFAKGAIRKHDECILVEGYTDVITLHQYGVENVVASSGTSLTVEQIRLIKRYTPNIKIIYDGDPAGIKAALRGLDMVLEEDMNVKLVLLPEGEDPDSHMKSQGVDGFKQYLVDHEEDFIFFKMNLLLGEAGDDPIKKSKVLKDIVSSLAKIPDMLKRSVYTQACSTRLDVDEKILISETNKIIKSDIKNKQFKREREELQKSRSEDRLVVSEQDRAPDQPIEVRPRIKGDEYQERDIIRVLIVHGNTQMDKDDETTVAAFILGQIAQFKDDWDNPLYKRILDLISDQVDKTQEISIDFFSRHEDDSVRELVIDFLSSPYEYADWEGRGIQFNNQKAPEENHNKDATHAVHRFLLRKIEKRRSQVIDLINKLKDDPSKGEELVKYIQMLQLLNQTRKDIAAHFGTALLY